ncbi:IS66 family insertion sequence element accessory protein TnpB [Sulfidibacter corallicola]|uniref:IS66 family insertion sequence element accessory protein TnpB n=1 Tax=Sulfidibacter corallicola TaxID=2818388 RepID=A0A8A4TQN5_SULCO|nr:IS66 family insertion sequence element accessory protein TnpB [Sulfidibacter corallicola]QTD51727.1 IS66 family insertion sequence element accessory protein TnpB [Sulfidibacter corallicola]
MRIFAACEPVDFRRGIDGLTAECRRLLNLDPFSGAVFLFRNRTLSALKILVYDGTGFWLCYKRLSRGKLKWWPVEGGGQVSARDLQVLLYHGDPRSAGYAPEWRRVQQPSVSN